MGPRSRAMLAVVICCGACCSGGDSRDAARDSSLDTGRVVSLDAETAARDVRSDDAPSRDSAAVDAVSRPDAAFTDESWLQLPGLSPECGVRLARDAAALLGAWAFGTCGDVPVAGCESLASRAS